MTFAKDPKFGSSRKPVTPAQVNYLAVLGWRGTMPANRRAAALLIDRLRRSK